MIQEGSPCLDATVVKYLLGDIKGRAGSWDLALGPWGFTVTEPPEPEANG